MMAVPRFLSRPMRGGGPLFVLGILFLLSGAVRLIEGSGVAVALEGGEAMPPNAACACDGPDLEGLEAALEAIRLREEELEARHAAMADRRAALEIAEETVAAMLAELRAAEDSLKQTMARSASAAEEDIERLTTVYENMKPAAATPLFAQMAPEFAAGFLGRMRPDAAAAILAGLEPDTAYAISVLLAGRNARAPTE